MILSNRFVFLHLPKTGGSFVRELLRLHAPVDWSIDLYDNHPTIREIPPSHQHLPILGLVRNPFAWYVSWYHYLKTHEKDPFFNKISQNGQRDFKATIMTAMEINIAEQFHYACHFSGSPFGCYMNYIFGNELERLMLGKIENLRHDLSLMLSQSGAIPAALEEQINTFPVVNQSDHAPYRSYYDAELRAAVEASDSAVLKRFDYHF